MKQSISDFTDPVYQTPNDHCNSPGQLSERIQGSGMPRLRRIWESAGHSPKTRTRPIHQDPPAMYHWMISGPYTIMVKPPSTRKGP
jgi:hypothetical protein